MGIWEKFGNLGHVVEKKYILSFTNIDKSCQIEKSIEK